MWRSPASRTMAVVLKSQSRFIGLVLAATVGWLPIAPQEHVHQAQDRGHQHVLVHRHLSAHTLPHESLHQSATVEDDDAPVLTIEAAYTVPSTFTLVVAPPVAIRFDEPPATTLSTRTPEYFGRLIHGPPRAPTGLRGPPLTSHL